MGSFNGKTQVGRLDVKTESEMLGLQACLKQRKQKKGNVFRFAQRKADVATVI